ncbi:MAG: hypothetical protein JKY08_09320 [Flavobacteriaceae bacterium]|nr:hypothetical protein [Flavobacteriaceae bacterium]
MMTVNYTRKIVSYFVLLILIVSCSGDSKNIQQPGSIETRSFALNSQKNDTTFFEMKKDKFISQKVRGAYPPYEINYSSLSEWKLIRLDSIYTFELLNISYLVPNVAFTLLFDTKLESVQIIEQLPVKLSFGEKARTEQQKALAHLKRIKNFRFSIVQKDSSYFYPSVKLPLKEISVKNGYDPAPEIQAHLDLKELLLVFDKMLLRPRKSFVLDSLYQDSSGSFEGSKYSNITLKHTFKTDSGTVFVKNTFNANHVLLNSEFTNNSSTTSVFMKYKSLKITTKLAVFIENKFNLQH